MEHPRTTEKKALNSDSFRKKDYNPCASHSWKIARNLLKYTNSEPIEHLQQVGNIWWRVLSKTENPFKVWWSITSCKFQVTLPSNTDDKQWPDLPEGTMHTLGLLQRRKVCILVCLTLGTMLFAAVSLNLEILLCFFPLRLIFQWSLNVCRITCTVNTTVRIKTQNSTVR